MVYRIDLQRFLGHAIDHFTREEIVNCQYAIFSAKITNGGTGNNMAKINQIYPTPDIVEAYAETHDKKILEKMYFDLMTPEKGDDSPWQHNVIYKTFINPLSLHYNIIILCDQIENDYVDVFCKYLKKKWFIEVIDLNELFTKGRVGPIYIDRDKVRDNAVDIRRAAEREAHKTLSQTEDGRRYLLGKLSEKNKLKLAEKDLGLKLSNADKKNIDQILEEEWVIEGD